MPFCRPTPEGASRNAQVSRSQPALAMSLRFTGTVAVECHENCYLFASYGGFCAMPPQQKWGRDKALWLLSNRARLPPGGPQRGLEDDGCGKCGHQRQRHQLAHTGSSRVVGEPQAPKRDGGRAGAEQDGPGEAGLQEVRLACAPSPDVVDLEGDAH